MFTISPTTYKHVTWTVSGLYIFGFVLFIVYSALQSPHEIEHIANTGWVKQPAADALFLLFGGVLFTILAVTLGIASWTKTADEFYDLITSTALWGGKWARWISKRYLLWYSQLISIPTILMGTLCILIGLASLLARLFE